MSLIGVEHRFQKNGTSILKKIRLYIGSVNKRIKLIFRIFLKEYTIPSYFYFTLIQLYINANNQGVMGRLHIVTYFFSKDSIIQHNYKDIFIHKLVYTL